MSHDPAISESEASRRRRFRFSLKAMFLLITLLCVIFGYTFGRHQRAAELERWDFELYELIRANVDQLPELAAFPATRQSRRFIPKEEQDHWRGNRYQQVLQDGELFTHWGTEITLDLKEALKVQTPFGVANRLLSFYEAGLREHGLRQLHSKRGEFEPPLSEPSSIWVSERPDFNTIVEVEVSVSDDTEQGVIRFRHYGRLVLRLW